MFREAVQYRGDSGQKAIRLFHGEKPCGISYHGFV